MGMAPRHSAPSGDTVEHNFISFNLENWITVLLMGALGYGLVVLAAQFFKQGGSVGNLLSAKA